MMPNLNKLFPRLSITTKLVIAFLALGMLPLVAYGIYSVVSLSHSLEEQSLRKLQFQIDATGREMSEFLLNVQADLVYIRSLSSLKKLATRHTADRSKRDGADVEHLRKQVEQDFLRFSAGKRAYYQIRYLDAAGREVVRLNRNQSGAYVVPKAQLQDKSSRYYVQEALQCLADEIYVSPMDLNIERGIVEVPLRPVVRYATPVLDGHNNQQGILIINIFAEAIFEIIGGVPREAVSFLTDRDGLYLYQSVRGTNFNYFRNRSLYDDYPAEVVQAVLSQGSGLTHTADQILAHSQIKLSGKSSDSWVLLLSVPKRVVFAALYKLKAGLLSILVALVVVASILGLIAARQFTRPIFQLTRGADLIAQGEFDQRIHVATNDELEDLSGHFNTMARRLGKSQAKLQRWNVELQNEVARRTRELTFSEAQLKIEKQKLDDIVSGVGAELCLIDRQQKVVWVNKTLADRCGGEDLTLGKTCYELFQNGDGPCPNCRCEHSFATSKGSKVVVNRKDAHGNERIFQVVSTPVVDVAGEVSHLLELHLDITDSVMRERALEKQSAEKARLASQVQLAAGVIHEVAKPLAAMKTTVQVLEDEIPDPEQRSYLEGVENEIDHLSDFLNTFSKFARPKPLQLQACKMEDIVNQVILLITKDAERRHIEIAVQGLSSLPKIKLDSIQMQQVLLNICVNAFEAMPDGGTLTIVGSVLQTSQPCVQLSISDTGIGMDGEQLQEIFEPFYSDKPNGSGLGLAIVRQIVRGHGGQIHVRSEFGKGTRFDLTFPV
ncbi:MAG: ATP-binding protein [bacterium]